MWPSVRDSSMVSSGVSWMSMSRAEDEGVLAIVVGVGEDTVMEGVTFFLVGIYAAEDYYYDV